MLYYVIEMQTNNGTGVVGFTQAYINDQDAFEKYHEIMRIAEKSSVDYHATMIINEDLDVIATELAKRPTYPESNDVWFVLELQSNIENGAVIPMAYTDKAVAWQKYYQILEYASVSTVPKHGSFMINHTLAEYHEQLAERANNNSAM